jgi:integral membrane sensor domain MASE1
MPKSKSKRNRYQPPPRKKPKPSPKWFGLLILGTMFAGILVIVLNYLGLMPGQTSPVWLFTGLGLIALGFIMATQLH